MAISENILFKKLSGHLGKQIVFKQYSDKTVVSQYPDMVTVSSVPNNCGSTK